MSKFTSEIVKFIIFTSMALGISAAMLAFVFCYASNKLGFDYCQQATCAPQEVQETTWKPKPVPMQQERQERKPEPEIEEVELPSVAEDGRVPVVIDD